VAADGDRLVFLREAPGERLLVAAARAATGPLRVPVGLLGPAGEAPNVFGGAPALVAGGASVEVPGDGPTFQVWRLP
jgi:alpha-glucosidase